MDNAMDKITHTSNFSFFLRLSLWVTALLVTLLYAASSRAETLHLTSLDWPPYSGDGLKNQGGSIAVAKAAFKAMGHELIVDFYPWSRAVALAKDLDSKYLGYFPEYYAQETEQAFIFSDVMGSGPLGFVENVDKPISWSVLSDLKDLQIGTVQGYVNTDEFDKLAAEGHLSVQPVVSDSRNLLKLVHHRIDVAIIDTNVFNYLMRNAQDLAPHKGKLKMNPRIIVDKELFVCFKKNEEGKRWASVFNEGLKKINIQQIMDQHLNP